MEITNRFLLYLLEQPHIWICCGILSFCLGIITLWVRRKRKVNCWFCKKDNYVNKLAISWWFCKNCEQFNGFDQNGDYLRDVPDMFSITDSCPRYCQTNKDSQKAEQKQSILCDKCQINQTLKVEKLRAFEPADERAFEWECFDYEHFLNDRYKLCSRCRKLSREEIKRQDEEIKEMYAEEFDKLRPSSLRKLKGKKPSKLFSSLLRKLLPLVLFCLSIIVLHVNTRNMEKNTKDYIFLGVAITALSFNIILTKLRRRLFVLQMISYVLWSNLVYSYGRFNQSHLSLALMALVELVSMVIQCFYFVSRKLKERRYLHERKSKLNKLTPTRRIVQEDDQTTKVEESFSENVSVVSDDFNSSMNESALNQSFDAPDLLQGDLHKMFIDRNERRSNSARKRVTNHVVAALRYKSRPSSPSTVKQPLLRPATFVYNKGTASSSSRSSLDDNNFDGPDNVSKQPEREEKEGKIAVEINTPRIDIATEDRKDSHKMKFVWKSLLLILLVLSILLNFAFICLNKKENFVKTNI